MELIAGIIALGGLYFLYKLFIDGWLFKGILFFAGWFGLYIALKVYVESSAHTAITLGTTNPFTLSWAAVVPTVICFLALLCTKVED